MCTIYVHIHVYIYVHIHVYSNLQFKITNCTKNLNSLMNLVLSANLVQLPIHSYPFTVTSSEGFRLKEKAKMTIIAV